MDTTEVTVDVFSEFFEVALHTILYVRDLYPEGVFQRRKKYGVPVQMCKHPEVAKYIGDLISSLRPLLAINRIRNVAMVILDQRQKPLERYVFEITEPSKDTQRTDTYMLHLEQSLRAFLLKLNTCDALLEPLPTDADPSWTVHVYTTDNAVMDLQQESCTQDFSWLQAEDAQIKMSQPLLIPLKAINSPILKMQLYIEESGTKR